MRNIWWIIGIAGVVLVGARAEASARAPLMSAFHATGAHATGYSINDWVELSGPIPDSLDATAAKVGDALKMTAAVRNTIGVGYIKAKETFTVAGITTNVIVERLSTGDIYLVIDRTSPEGFAGLSSTETLFNHLLASHGTVHTDVNLEGTISQHLSPLAQQRLINTALERVGATTENGIRAPGYISDAGRSPFIVQHDELQGHPLNIQIATSYNPFMHKTEVYVGSPLITVTY